MKPTPIPTPTPVFAAVLKPPPDAAVAVAVAVERADTRLLEAIDCDDELVVAEELLAGIVDDTDGDEAAVDVWPALELLGVVEVVEVTAAAVMLII